MENNDLIQKQLYDAISAQKVELMVDAIAKGADLVLPRQGGLPNYEQEAFDDEDNFNALQYATYMMVVHGQGRCFEYLDKSGFDLAQVARQFIRPKTLARDMSFHNESGSLLHVLKWWPEEYGDWKIWTDSQTGQGLAHQFAESNPWRFCVLAAMGMKIDGQDKHGNTPLHLSTSARCYQKIIELHGDLRTLNNFGLTPLTRQVFNNLPEKAPDYEAQEIQVSENLYSIAYITQVARLWDEPQKVEIAQRLQEVITPAVRIQYKAMAEETDSLENLEEQVMEVLSWHNSQRLNEISRKARPGDLDIDPTRKPKL